MLIFVIGFERNEYVNKKRPGLDHIYKRTTSGKMAFSWKRGFQPKTPFLKPSTSSRKRERQREVIFGRFHSAICVLSFLDASLPQRGAVVLQQQQVKVQRSSQSVNAKLNNKCKCELNCGSDSRWRRRRLYEMLVWALLTHEQ